MAEFLNRVTVIAGKRGSGKSQLLRALLKGILPLKQWNSIVYYGADTTTDDLAFLSREHGHLITESIDEAKLSPDFCTLVVVADMHILPEEVYNVSLRARHLGVTMLIVGQVEPKPRLVPDILLTNDSKICKKVAPTTLYHGDWEWRCYQDNPSLWVSRTIKYEHIYA